MTQKICINCQGSGLDPEKKDDEIFPVCPRCKGSGKDPDTAYDKDIDDEEEDLDDDDVWEAKYAPQNEPKDIEDILIDEESEDNGRD